MQTQCRELIAIGVDCHSNTDSAEYGESLSSATADSPLQVPPSLALAARAKMRAVGWEYDPSVPSTPQSPALSYGSAHTMNSCRGYHQPLPPLPFPECCFHKALVDRLEFIEPPRVTDAGVGLIRGACFRLFIGQIKFETTAAEMRWLIHYLTGVSPLKVEVRGMGCCMAYFETYEEIQQVCALRARLLFDHTGVWFARTEEQQALLHRYVAYYVSQIGRGFRLPKDMCVLEEERFQFIPALPQGCHFDSLNTGWQRAGGRPPLPPPRRGMCSGAETHFDAEHLW